MMVRKMAHFCLCVRIQYILLGVLVFNERQLQLLLLYKVLEQFKRVLTTDNFLLASLASSPSFAFLLHINLNGNVIYLLYDRIQFFYINRTCWVGYMYSYTCYSFQQFPFSFLVTFLLFYFFWFTFFIVFYLVQFSSRLVVSYII